MDADIAKPQSFGLDEDEISRLDLLSVRLKHSVTPLQILAWLQQYDVADRDAILEILGAVEFVTEADLLALINRCFEQWVGKNPGVGTDITLFNPISEYGKSGTLITYYLKKCPSFVSFAASRKCSFCPTPSEINHFLKRDKTSNTYQLCLYDDFVASGDTVSKHLRQFYRRLCADARFSSLSLIAPFTMDLACSRVRDEFSRVDIITAEERSKVFSDRQSPFGSHATELREVAHRYGQKLCRMPLGYGNAQALLVFPYGCPNNTLPILWSSTANWRPLFPRHSSARIEFARAFRKECAFLLSKARELQTASVFLSGKVKTHWRTKQFVTRTDFTLFTIVRLLRQRRDKATICQIVGISGSDYEESIAEAQRRGILDASVALTEGGLREYSVALSRLSAFHEESKKANTPNKTIDVYVPRTFEGES